MKTQLNVYAVDAGAEMFWFSAASEDEAAKLWAKLCDEWEIAEEERAATIRKCSEEELDRIQIVTAEDDSKTSLRRAASEMDEPGYIAGTVW